MESLFGTVKEYEPAEFIIVNYCLSASAGGQSA